MMLWPLFVLLACTPRQQKVVAGLHLPRHAVFGSRTKWTTGGRSAITSPLFQSTASLALGNNNNNNNNITPKRGVFSFSKRILASRIGLLLAVFSVGYGLGVRTGGGLASGAARVVRQAPSRFPVAFWLLMLVLARDAWGSVPEWLKPRLFQRAVSDTQVLLGLKSKEQAEEELAEMNQKSGDDIADFSTLFGKLGTVRGILLSRLPYDDDGKPSFNFRASFFALLKLTRRIKEANLTSRDVFFQGSGRPATFEDMDGLYELMEYSDWAYDEGDKPLKDLLDERGYILLKHDKTTVPGFLGHYVAIPKDPTNKVALIGVKGSSNLEDLITDSCAAAVDVNLDGPYYKYGEESKNATATTLRAHEGVMIGTRRLANDLRPFVENLLLPQGYKLVIVGHSLGAAASALLGILLRSQIPDLQQYDTREEPSNELMQIYAFASPPTLDLDNALKVRSFVTTVVNNCDIVTRCNVSPLQATIDVLKDVAEKLEKSKEFEKKNTKGRWKFWKKNISGGKEEKRDEGEKEELVQEANDLMETIGNATTTITKNADDDHLYVPGKVVLLYDEWGTNQTTVVKDASGNTTMEFEDHVADRAIVCDGTARPLQYIEFDTRMLEDHMTEDYKNSIQKVTLSLNETHS
jgi:hypothetical protein